MRFFEMFLPKYYKTHKIKFKTSIRIYTGILKINTLDNTFDLDIYIGEPYWEDGTQKYLGECQNIGGWHDEPLTNPKRVIACARETIEEYELPERTANYLQLNNNFFNFIEDEDEDFPKYEEPERPEIHDHEEKAYRDYINYLMQNPHELELMDKKEREELFKKHHELKQRYKKWYWLEKEPDINQIKESG